MDEKLLRETVERTVRERLSKTGTSDTVKHGDMLENITLSAALSLCDAVKQKASEMGVNAVISVCDRGGNTVLLERMDDGFIASCDIAMNKAYTSVALKMSTAALKPLAQPECSLYGIQFTNHGKIVIFGGGEPLKNRNGVIIGGLGVSGGSEEQDTALGAFGRECFEKGIKC